MKVVKLPKVLKLNYRTWICGDKTWNWDGDERPKGILAHGKGESMLVNPEGYMCCLGQFCSQANVDKKSMLDIGDPHNIDDIFVEGLVEECSYTLSKKKRNDLASRAISINDSHLTTVAEKVVKLKKLFREHGYVIQLVNFPQKIRREVRNLQRKERKEAAVA